MRINHTSEVKQGERFEFGTNWALFLNVLNDKRISQAEQSLQKMLGVTDLRGKTFLDIGSGSGLFSLAARRMGATVHSFDYDLQSVACTRRLQNQYFPGDTQWKVEEGSVLDQNYLRTLGQFDVVYSWGVLHHTGAMWQALENVAPLVAENGRLFIAIYNDQGRASHYWMLIKKMYNRLPGVLKWMVLLPVFIRLWGPTTIRDALMMKPFATWKDYVQQRGMMPWRDVVDWVGGYPFEVAKPEQIFEFYRKKNFRLDVLKTSGGGLGCNDYIFTKKVDR